MDFSNEVRSIILHNNVAKFKEMRSKDSAIIMY